MKVTIIGAGNMGRGIGIRAIAGGNDVEVIDRDPQEAQALANDIGASAATTPSGELVVFALPYPAVAEVIAEHASALAGKVVVDITNPVDWSTMAGLVTPEGSSAAEEIAKQLPDAHVVKAFNTTFAGTLVAGEAHGQKLDVLIAGDADEAKGKVSQLVSGGGLRPLDVGPLARARQLEHLGFLHIAIQEPLGLQFGSAIKLHP